MHLISQSHTKFEESKKLNIQVDPWDHYLYYDSKFFFDFIFNSNDAKVKLEEKFIGLKFLLFIYHNDLMSNFKGDGRTIAWKLNEFLHQITEEGIGNESNYLNEFIRNVLFNKHQPNEQEVEKFETKLETVFNVFLQYLTTRKLFSEIKEDYFKI